MTNLVIIVIRKIRLQTVANKNASLESPRAGDIAHCVTATAQDQGGQVEALDEVDAVRVASHAQVETSQAITRETVTTTLKNHGFWTVPLHNALDHRLEDTLVRDIVDAVTKWEIDSIVFALSHTDVTELTGTREILSILVERHSHDTVCSVKCLLDTIAMVDINIDVENALPKA